MWRRPVSLKVYLVGTMLMFLVPLILYLLFFNFYMLSAMDEQVIETNQKTLDLYTDALDENFRIIDGLMVDMVTNNPDFLSLRMKKSVLDQYMHAYEVTQQYKSWINSHSLISALCLAAPEQNLFRTEYSNIGFLWTLDVKEAVNAQVQQMISDKSYQPRWTFIDASGHSLLCRVLHSGEVYAVCLVDLEHIYATSDPHVSAQSRMLFAQGDRPLTQRAFMEANSIMLGSSEKDAFLTRSRRFLLMSEKISKTDVSLVYAIPYDGSLQNVSRSQIFLFLVAFLSIPCIPLLYVSLKRTVLEPLDHLKATIDDIQSGNINATVDTRYTIFEFNQVLSAFNKMVSELIVWKNSFFEKTIAEQKARLQYLLMQIRPHFYLNSLKTLYGMAEIQQYQDLKKMILLLSKHLRFMLSDTSALISLETELEHIRNYIDLQQMGKAYEIHYNQNVEHRHMQCAVPPISLLTIVENTIKHWSVLGEGPTVNIATKLLNDPEGDILFISIADTGLGFSEEGLKMVNGTEPPENGHVGIWNVRQRLYYLYGDRASLFALNQNGACVQIYLPFRQVQTLPREMKQP